MSVNFINGTSANTLDKTRIILNGTFRGENKILAERLIEVVDGLKRYWPVTVRQVYYQAVAKLYLSNNVANYRKVSRTLTKLRIAELVPWRAVEDRTRRTIDKQGISSAREFFKNDCDRFLNTNYFHLCRVIDQPVYIELATEKDALSSIIEGAIRWHCVRLNVVRGQVSATMVNNMAERFEQAYFNGKEPVLIYFGDLDPSGIAIPRALIRNMAEIHGVDVRLVRAGLNPEQLDEYGLPESMDAAKEADPNIDMWHREFSGVPPTELDALHPAELGKLAKDSLEAELDMNLYDARDKEEQGAMEKFEIIRESVLETAHEEYESEFGGTE